MTTATTERTRRTKPPQLPPPDSVSRPPVEDLAARIGREQLELSQAAETIFAKSQDTWTAGDWAVIRRVAPRGNGPSILENERTKRWITVQVGRVQRRLELQQRAGSSAERAATKKAAEEAAAVLAQRQPEIEDAIRVLQDELATIAQAAHRATAEVESREQAVVSLRDRGTLPEHILDEIASLKTRHAEQFGRELSSVRGRLQAIASIAALDPSTDDGFRQIQLHVESERGLGPDTIGRLKRFFVDRNYTEDEREQFADMAAGQARLSRSFFAKTLNAGEWRTYCQSLRREAASLAPRLAELESLESAAAAEIERLKDYLVPA